MSIANSVKAIVSRSSLIRQMFEKGARLKAEHGAENVFDFSIGNPNLAPPATFKQELVRAAADESPGIHGYMPNTGYPETRRAVAEFVSEDQKISLTEQDIVMTCGAAGGLNVIFRSLLNPGEEVLVPAPYFVEYGFYAANANATLKSVPTNPDFSLSIPRIAEALTPATKIVLINSPNNPTGQIYSEQELDELGALLDKAAKQFGHTLYLVADEPYRRIVYDGAPVPSIFNHYKESILTTSFSKDLSIPGERIGYIAVHPDATHRNDILDAMALVNRTLGFVNAPALMQRVLPKVIRSRVDMDVYARNRQQLCDGLAAAATSSSRRRDLLSLPQIPCQR